MLSSLSSSAPALVWRQADADFYVATLDGQYAGFVTTGTAPATFDAESGHGADLGAHTTAGAAAAAVAAAAVAAAARPAPPRGGGRAPRRRSPPPRLVAAHAHLRHALSRRDGSPQVGPLGRRQVAR